MDNSTLTTAIITNQMTIDDKIDYTLNHHQINENMFNSSDLCCVFKIMKSGFSYIHIVGSRDLWNTMSQLYNGLNAEFVDVLRIVDVKLSNENWDYSDFTGEIYSCMEEYQLSNHPLGFYNGESEKNIIDFFDYKLMTEQFNTNFMFHKKVNITYQHINVAEDVEIFDPYIYNCVGEEYPNMTNGSQFCRQTFCESEDNPPKRQKLG